MQILHPARAEHPKHPGNLGGLYFIPVGTGSSLPRIKWPDCDTDHSPNIVKRSRMDRGLLSHSLKASVLSYLATQKIYLYILTYLLKLAKRTALFHDKLVWCWHSPVQCMSVEVHYHSPHSWQIQRPDLSLNLAHSYKI
jgi:hypothetical protein